MDKYITLISLSKRVVIYHEPSDLGFNNFEGREFGVNGNVLKLDKSQFCLFNFLQIF